MTAQKPDDNHTTPRGAALAAAIPGTEVITAADLWNILDTLYTHWDEHARTSLADLMEKWQDELVQAYPKMETV